VRLVRRLGIGVGVVLLLAGGTVIVVSEHQADILIHNPPEERAEFLRHHPDLDPEQRLAAYGLAGVAEPVNLLSEDGLSLNGIYVPSRNGAGVMVEHGYKDTYATEMPIAAMLVRHGYGVIVLELRAHGGSDGETISFGRSELLDLAAAYKYLVARPDVDPRRIGILGESMGGALAILFAAVTPDVRAVVAESPYASVDNTVEVSVSHFTGLPAFPFANVILFFMERKLGFDLEAVSPLAYIGAISPRPVFLMMGGKDTFVNPKGGKLLYDAAGEPRELWFDPELGHVEFSTERAVEFETRVTAFFGEYLTAPSP